MKLSDDVGKARKQIKKARMNAGLTQKEFGNLLEYSLRSVQAWEAGDKVMHKSTWKLLQMINK